MASTRRGMFAEDRAQPVAGGSRVLLEPGSTFLRLPQWNVYGEAGSFVPGSQGFPIVASDNCIVRPGELSVS